MAGGQSKVREVEQELGEGALHEHPHEVSQLPHDSSGKVFANDAREEFEEISHQLLNLLHIEKTLLILFPRIRQNLHRFYKVGLVSFLQKKIMLVFGGGDVGQG